jgi:hypothetical protein
MVQRTLNPRPWHRVVFSCDVDPDTDECPICGEEYPTCPCPGPTMSDEFEYREVDGVLWGRRWPE